MSSAAPSPSNATSPSPPPSTPSPTSPPSSPGPSPPSAPPPKPPSPASSPPPPPPSPTLPPGASSPPPPPSTKSSPPPPSTKSPPPPPPSTTSPPSSSSSTTLIIGVAVGGALLLLLVTVAFLCCRKKRRRTHYGSPPPSSQPPYHPPKDAGTDPYGGRPKTWQSTAPPPSDNVVKISNSPSTTPPIVSQPPPPPLLISSGGGSGSVYSGSEALLAAPSPGLSLALGRSTFMYEELAIATDGFSPANLLGQGGFGYVHKGTLRNGKEIAVKQLKAGSGQGDREFQAEVEIISRVHHKHLVSLVGYCITGSQRLLVYEFVPNNTLEFHLHGKGRPTMEWPTRLKIAVGSAKGLAYLHEDCHPRIIHRDIKSANILLDFNFEAKVADFGLAKLSSETDTHVSTRVMGTFGYLAPEYASSGKLTEKSDVFSFGVMLLELITGRKPVDTSQAYMDDSLVDWARPLLTQVVEDGNHGALVDPGLQNNYNHDQMACMIACAAAAVRHSAKKRPRMSQIERVLEGGVSLDDLNEGVKPGHSTVYGYTSSDYDSGQYREDMRRFKKVALGSQEYGTSGQSEPTSDHGLNASTSSSSEGQRTLELEMERMKRNAGHSGS